MRRSASAPAGPPRRLIHEPHPPPPASGPEAKLPPRRLCGTMTVHHRLLELDPGFRARQLRLERATARAVERAVRARRRGPPQVVTIPVVVHVVYHTEAENLPAAQIARQIAVLNRDFRARNADRTRVPEPWRDRLADAGIEFALARTDPRGRPTSGITRTETARRSFGDDDAVKSAVGGGADPWPADRYLNLWVCNLTPWLGYAQFPGGPPRTDGVVLLHRAFGAGGTAEAPFDRGRTATHEIGHWLNLRHVWGDTEDCTGGDFVADTPNAATPNFGKPRYPHVSCGNGPHGDMFMNFMDYVDDDSMCLFTRLQAARMRAALAGPRRGLLTRSPGGGILISRKARRRPGRAGRAAGEG